MVGYYRKWMRFCGVLLVSCFVLLAPSVLYAIETALPLTLDYKLLSILLEENAFTGAGGSAAIVGTPRDCTFISASQPKFSSAHGRLQLELRVSVRLGTEMGDNCLVPVAWEGYLVILQQPVFDSRNFSLSFKSIDASLFTLDRQPATIAGMVWDFAQPQVFSYLNRIHINLAPPVQDLKTFLQPLFPEETRQATQAMLDSLQGGRVLVNNDNVVVELLANVQEIYNPHEESGEIPILNTEERTQIIQLWETWDAFLVQLLAMMAAHPLSEEDHQILIDVLLDTRHVFAAALENNEVDEDFVRSQFVSAWKQLSPVFRRQLLSQPADNTLGYLGFFTAADALAVLDRMGPTLGLEISRNGLLRLVRMLTGADNPLQYDLKVDSQLRKLLGFPPLSDDSPASEPPPEDGIPTGEQAADPLGMLQNFLLPSAFGAATPSYAEIQSWKVPDDDVDGYIGRVRALVAEATEAQLGKKTFDKSLRDMFRQLIPAMAWQESCFRQFVVKRAKLTYLLSYNQSSVGLMQVNERVWRGIYDRNMLRWDIHYNVQAGCEIADLYLRRYILKKATPAILKNRDLVAKLVYALYNGGPGQYAKFLAREKSGRQYKSDRLFAEKLAWVKAKAWDKLRLCLVGG